MEITIKHNGSLLTYKPLPGTDLSKLDIVAKDGISIEELNKIATKPDAPSIIDPTVKPTPRFKGGDECHKKPEDRKPNDVAITSDAPYEGLHKVQENFWYNDNGEIMPDDKKYRFNSEYVQLCKRKFDCYVPNYTNKSPITSGTIIVDMSKNEGMFDDSYGEVTDNSNAMELNKLSVIDIAKYMYEGVPVSTHNRNDAYHILVIVNDSLDKYIGAIPVAPTTFVAPEEWLEPLLYLRESILETRPGLIKKLAHNFDHAGKPRKPRLQKIKLC